MRPTLFHIGPLPIRGYGLMVAIGFLVAIFTAARQAKKEGFQSQIVFDLGLYILISALLGARIFHAIQHIKSYDSLIDIFKVWQGGLAYYGGFILAFVVSVLYLRWKKLSIVRFLDILGPSMIIGLGIGRLGCFLAGCCFGKPTTLPWGVRFPEESLAYLEVGAAKIHPTQLYSALFLFLAFIALNSIRKYMKFHGQLFLVTVIIYSTFRFLIDFLRYYTPEEHIGSLTTSQVVSIIAWVISIIFMVIFSIRNAKNADPAKTEQTKVENT